MYYYEEFFFPFVLLSPSTSIISSSSVFVLRQPASATTPVFAQSGCNGRLAMLDEPGRDQPMADQWKIGRQRLRRHDMQGAATKSAVGTLIDLVVIDFLSMGSQCNTKRDRPTQSHPSYSIPIARAFQSMRRALAKITLPQTSRQ